MDNFRLQLQFFCLFSEFNFRAGEVNNIEYFRGSWPQSIVDDYFKAIGEIVKKPVENFVQVGHRYTTLTNCNRYSIKVLFTLLVYFPMVMLFKDKNVVERF